MSHATPGPVENDWRAAIASTEDIIAEAKAGRMFILVDHEDRENEGDLIIPAQMADADAVNFMARHGRGLICLALEADRIAALGLPLMSTRNSSRHETAFTVSIEAREGISTGISAADRARTVAVAIHPDTTEADLATPGHVFPLRARDGGVLVRAGHTEAAVDISRLAGLDPSGVICEIMKDDGEMARLPDLVDFAQHHGMKIGTISDLIAFRRRHDNFVTETARRTATATGGEWLLRVFVDRIEGTENVVLSKGDLTTPEPVLVRAHALDVMTDVFGIGGGGEVQRAMEIIAEAGRGAICLFRNPKTPLLQDVEGGPKTVREIGLGSQILSTLGLTKLVLLTDHAATKYVGIDAYGLEIVGTHPLSKG